MNIKPLKFLILDEGDRLLDMGFKKQIDDILKRIKDKLNENSNITSLSQLENEEEIVNELDNNERQYQTILCSATLNDDIIRLASSLLTNPKYYIYIYIHTLYIIVI